MPDTDDGSPADLDVRAADPHVYDVTIGHPSGATTEHRVTVPEALLADLGLSAAQEPILVRVALTYLLEHRPSALPEHFDLDEIGRALPEFRETVVARV